MWGAGLVGAGLTVLLCLQVMLDGDDSTRSADLKDAHHSHDVDTKREYGV